MSKTKIPALSVGILAGGRSSRMGENKALIKIENQRIIDRLTKELGGFSEVLISCAPGQDYGCSGTRTVYDEHRDLGPMEGIRRILAEAKEEYVFICASDMPYMDRDLVEYLAGYISSDYDCYVVTDGDHIQPLCAIYKRSILPEIEDLIEHKSLRLMALLDRVRTKYISLSDSRFDKKTVKNLNTRKDLMELGKPFVFCVSGYSGSGKTYLIEKLINEFIGDGYTVGVCKHDGHDVYEDRPGSDTDRYMRAGAAACAVYTKSRFMMNAAESRDEYDMTELMSSLKDPPDIIILEGLKSSDHPKVVVTGKGEKSVPEGIRKPYICIAADEGSSIESQSPIYGRDNIREIFSCIREYFGIGAKDEADKNC